MLDLITSMKKLIGWMSLGMVIDQVFTVRSFYKQWLMYSLKSTCWQCSYRSFYDADESVKTKDNNIKRLNMNGSSTFRVVFKCLIKQAIARVHWVCTSIEVNDCQIFIMGFLKRFAIFDSQIFRYKLRSASHKRRPHLIMESDDN